MSRTDGWRLRVSHETRFDYDAPARASYNELRLTPRTETRQTALETKVVTLPPAPQYSYIDYWGTSVVAFNVDRGHEVLTITGNSLVDTQNSSDPENCTWEDISDAAMTMADHLSPNLYTAPGPELSDIAQGLRTDRPLETARRIMASTHDALRYVRGVTSVHTSANEAYADGAGVCQDFAHTMIALLRHVRIPARYVSGYLFRGSEDKDRSTPDATHAWVEALLPHLGWVGFDPTNGNLCDHRHITAAVGLTPEDVSPVLGSYYPAGVTSLMSASLQIIS